MPPNSPTPPRHEVAAMPARRELLKRAAGIAAASVVLPNTVGAANANETMRATGAAAFGKRFSMMRWATSRLKRSKALKRQQQAARSQIGSDCR